MNDNEKYIYEMICTRVWSGYDSDEEVYMKIDDVLEDDVDEAMIRECVPKEFEKKRVAEEAWPDETSCDRLDLAFDELNSRKVVALQDAGYTMSDGLDDVNEIVHRIGRKKARGYCFFHGQDLERAVQGGSLLLAFGDLDDTREGNIEVANLVIETMKKHGFESEWNGDPDTRISLAPFPWQRRYEEW